MHLLTLSGRCCAGAVVALGTTVLAGWAFDITALKGVLPGLATMKANTALCFVLAGAALALVSFPSSVIARWIGQGCAGIVLLVALLTLGEQLTPFDLGIDELLVRNPDTPRDLNPGRTAPATSLGFVMAGLLAVGKMLRAVSAGEAGALGDGAYTAVCEESEHYPTPDRTAQ